MKELAGNWFRADQKETASTMLDLLLPELQSRKEEFVLVTADFQTAGRGQHGTAWEAERGKNLLFGFSLHPGFLKAGEQFRLSEILALAIAAALDGYTDGGFCIKWPNDIYFGNRKICGMLLEHDLHGNRIATTRAGIGINVNQRAFRSGAPNPVALYEILGYETDRETLLLRILDEFEKRYRRLQTDKYAPETEYLQRLYRREGVFPYRDAAGRFLARIAGVEPTGRLLVEDDKGSLRRYAFKEVVFELC